MAATIVTCPFKSLKRNTETETWLMVINRPGFVFLYNQTSFRFPSVSPAVHFTLEQPHPFTRKQRDCYYMMPRNYDVFKAVFYCWLQKSHRLYCCSISRLTYVPGIPNGIQFLLGAMGPLSSFCGARRRYQAMYFQLGSNESHRYTISPPKVIPPSQVYRRIKRSASPRFPILAKRLGPGLWRMPPDGGWLGENNCCSTNFLA